jgi:hypothetical protein
VIYTNKWCKLDPSSVSSRIVWKDIAHLRVTEGAQGPVRKGGLEGPFPPGVPQSVQPDTVTVKKALQIGAAAGLLTVPIIK